MASCTMSHGAILSLLINDVWHMSTHTKRTCTLISGIVWNCYKDGLCSAYYIVYNKPYPIISILLGVLFRSWQLQAGHVLQHSILRLLYICSAASTEDAEHGGRI